MVTVDAGRLHVDKQSLSSPPDPNPPTAHCKVLIVEDDRPTRMLLERIIHARGHEVVGCESAEAAIKKMKEEFFPLITLDIQLPGMSGLDFARLLRARPDGSHYYILVGTANNRADELREILGAGADDYIAKPYNSGLLDVRLTVAESSVKEIARRKKLESELKFLAQHDPLTRLFNRSQIDGALQAAVGVARAGRPGVVMYLDLDNFKIINDTLGHDVGDKLLLQVATTLRGHVREGDFLVRFGGDEFVFILPDCALEDAVRIGESLVERIGEIVFIEKGRTFNVGASIGICDITGQSEPTVLMGSADAACYAAKAHGRNRVEVYTGETNEIARLVTDTDWSTRIRNAMEDSSLQIWFQPVVCVNSGTIIFQEVLLRYFDPESGLPVSPTVFLSAMERFGHSTKVDRFVIAKAFGALVEHPDLTVSINISGALFGDGSYCEFVEGLVSASGLDAKRIIFEITESELIPNLQSASGSIKRLQALGCRFALDDFGSGFSSLTYLQNLPVDFIKIAGTFVEDLPRQAFNQAVLRAIKIIAEPLNIPTIAEFVEEVDECDVLREIGISMAQGHFFGRPRSAPYQQSEISI